MMLLHLDPHDSLNLRKSAVYEPRMTAYVKKSVRPGMTAVDVGAHIGYYTTLLARLVGPAGAVYAFEPEPENANRLRLNAEAYPGVRIFPCAVSDHSGMARLYLSKGNSGDHRLFEIDGRAPLEVPVVALDEMPELKDKVIDFLKIDAQGSETKILRGARTLLARSPRLKGIIEVAPIHLRQAGSSVAELLDLCAELGLDLGRKRTTLMGLKHHETITMRRVPK
jgi:FkbM family methyltransferase